VQTGVKGEVRKNYFGRVLNSGQYAGPWILITELLLNAHGMDISIITTVTRECRGAQIVGRMSI